MKNQAIFWAAQSKKSKKKIANEDSGVAKSS